jgi:histidine triad (HIT) family protein
MSKKSDCIFCRIIQGEIESPKVFENEEFICIRDIRPQAKTHLLVIPKKHIDSLEMAFQNSETNERANERELMGALLETTTQIAKSQGLLPGGFRTVINTNQHGGQTVFHIHLHLLGGEPLAGGFGV